MIEHEVCERCLLGLMVPKKGARIECTVCSNVHYRERSTHDRISSVPSGTSFVQVETPPVLHSLLAEERAAAQYERYLKMGESHDAMDMYVTSLGLAEHDMGAGHSMY